MGLPAPFPWIQAGPCSLCCIISFFSGRWALFALVSLAKFLSNLTQTFWVSFPLGGRIVLAVLEGLVSHYLMPTSIFSPVPAYDLWSSTTTFYHPKVPCSLKRLWPFSGVPPIGAQCHLFQEAFGIPHCGSSMIKLHILSIYACHHPAPHPRLLCFVKS